MHESNVVGPTEKVGPEEHETERYRQLYGPPDGSTEGFAGEFQRMYLRGELTKEQVLALFQKRNPFPQEQDDREFALDWGEAQEILGPEKVLTPKQTHNIWGYALPRLNKNRVACPRRYLEKAAKENERGENWRLFLAPPYSYRQIYQRLNRQINMASYCCSKQERPWFDRASGPQVELVNFRGSLTSLTWHRQERSIHDMGPGYCRADDRIVALGALGFYRANGERLLSRLHHWGNSKTSIGSRIYVSQVDHPSALSIDHMNQASPTKQLGVCIALNIHSGLLFA